MEADITGQDSQKSVEPTADEIDNPTRLTGQMISPESASAPSNTESSAVATSPSPEKPAVTPTFSPPAATAAPTGPAVVVGGTEGPTNATPAAGSGFKGSTTSSTSGKSKKILFASVAAVVVLGGAAAAYYFGYAANPSVIYSQSLTKTGKGYDKLIAYVDQQSKQTNKGYSGTGSYTFSSSSFSTDGKIGLQSNGKDGEFTVDVGLGVSRVSADLRTIKSTGETPDIYLKASGLNGLGDLLGAPPAITTALNKLDNTWIVVDHTLIDNATKAAAMGAASQATSPTREDIMDEARAFGKVNQQYVFSTEKDKAVTKVVKSHGEETVEGHKAYHYTVALQKDNVKKYITAQRDALKASKLGTWLKQNNYDSVYSSFDDAVKSADNIKSSDTFEIWMDADQHIVYKVRKNDKNAAENYVDIGLNYKGGDSYPFFISGQDKSDGNDVTFSLVTTLDTKSNAVTSKVDVKDNGVDGGSLAANFTYKPSTSPIQIDTPSGAKPLAQVFNDLGYGDLYKQYIDELNAAASAPNDSLLTN